MSVTKPEIGAVCLSVAALFAGLFAALETHRTGDALASLEQKLSRLESAPTAEAGGGAPKGPSNADLARDINALRSQIAGLSARPAVVTPKSEWKPPPANGTAVVPAPPPKSAVSSKEDAANRQRLVVEAQANSILRSMVAKLGLTEQQGVQVREVVLAQIVEWQERRKTVAEADMKQALEDFLKDANAKIKVSMTPEQQGKFDELAKGPSGFFGIGASNTLLSEPGPASGPR